MKAVVCRAFGPPESLEIVEVDDPKPGPQEIVIDVRAAAITFPDALMIEDKYQFKPRPPFIPGGDVAGIVLAVGEGVQGFSVGDRVTGALGLVGGFAERAKVRVDAARRLADSVGFAESTGLLYAYGTGYYGLKHRGDLGPGQTLLILGASGALGMAAIEIGKLLGARVIAAAGSEKKLAVCRQQGADELIDYDNEDLKERAKALTDGQGVDVVYDCVGGDYAEAALRAIAWKGRFLVIGFTAGIPKIPLNLALLKGCQIVGVFLGAMTGKEPALRDEIERELLAELAAGRLNPHVSGRYSLEAAPQALRDMLDRKVVGKIVIEP
jgi:NADPH2:quinone reductase